MYLLDTNVVSELRKGVRADAGVRAFFASCDSSALSYPSRSSVNCARVRCAFADEVTRCKLIGLMGGSTRLPGNMLNKSLVSIWSAPNFGDGLWA